jgi:hypothetical protein
MLWFSPIMLVNLNLRFIYYCHRLLIPDLAKLYFSQLFVLSLMQLLKCSHLEKYNYYINSFIQYYKTIDFFFFFAINRHIVRHDLGQFCFSVLHNTSHTLNEVQKLSNFTKVVFLLRNIRKTDGTFISVRAIHSVWPIPVRPSEVWQFLHFIECMWCVMEHWEAKLT